MMFTHRIAVSFLVGALVLAGTDVQGRADPAVTFSLVGSDITIDSGATEGRFTMVLKADNLDAADQTQALGPVSDLNAPIPPPVDLKFAASDLSHDAATRQWLLTADYKGLPANAKQQRYLSFKFGTQTFTLPYTVSNKSSATFAWSVKPPPAEISLKAGDSIEIGVAVTQSVAATNVRVLQTALVEQTRKTPLDGGLMLCKQTAGPCTGDGVNLGPNSSNKLWLRTNSAGTLVGKYIGTVTIGAAEKPEGETLSNLTIYGTTLCRQLLGVLFIIIGVAGAWVVTVWAQNRLNRLQALLPATLLRDRVRALQQRLQLQAEPTPHTNEALAGLARALSEKELDKYLPSVMPLPGKSSGLDMDGYKHFLQKAGTEVALLEVLVDEGILVVWKKITPQQDQASRRDISAASGQLDVISDSCTAEPPPAQKDIIDNITSIINTLNGQLRAHAGQAAALQQRAPLASIQPKTFEQLQIEIRDVSVLAWLVYGAVAAAVGVYVLIINNLGFGIPSDYFFCLLWGFGLPVGGQQLATATFQSVGTAMGIQLPRAQ
jgi:hypothetical protein